MTLRTTIYHAEAPTVSAQQISDRSLRGPAHPSVWSIVLQIP